MSLSVLMPVAPFLVRPHYVKKPWGGRRLETVLGRADLPEGPVGESWEVGDLEEWQPLVEGGPHDGRPLRKVWGGPFPLLVKVLDANEDLSVQVHPDGQDDVPAKEEAWVALADGGRVAVGRVDARDLPPSGTWLERLDRLALSAGRGESAPSIVHVPAGTVHAILAGALVWEVQTPVNITWRLDDYGRLGLDGKPRALHVDEATAVLARGGEASGQLSADGRGLEGRRLELATHPRGTWERPPGCVLFLAEGGEVEWAGGRGDGEAGVPGGTVQVPPGRTVVLTPLATRARSAGWMLAAGPSVLRPPVR